MIPFADLWPILLGWAIAVSSPGPAVLAIVGAAMGGGRAKGVAVAVGVWNGSMVWATVAAFGLGAAMMAHVWIFELIRYAGAGYLLWLAFKSARSAVQGQKPSVIARSESLAQAWARGFTIHLMNPKAPLLWGSLYAVVVPAQAGIFAIVQVGLSCVMISLVMMSIMALVFSIRFVSAGYLRLHRIFDATFATLFGSAALKVMTSKLA
ncbi:threonine/homoserine/homoserine lactone efflux protein [Pacificibacter maritimus]|uniref:Threonine/homoserine/homoserine lactone efflux protein n=1 Tax=Pacificibacter maritimus TaxID=762213 RepID=A0A3N4TXI6_9RHOB|nr:LysE family translocator [Pacificibacter maritimus]RPE63226.1 threonine/homoserine/homoserine lactone efflux protein [Pacificibacter maritimus]